MFVIQGPRGQHTHRVIDKRSWSWGKAQPAKCEWLMASWLCLVACGWSRSSCMLPQHPARQGGDEVCCISAKEQPRCRFHQTPIRMDSNLAQQQVHSRQELSRSSSIYGRQVLKPGEFRVLHLLPKSPTDNTIRTELETRPLETEEAPYEALSYTWGSLPAGKTISTLDGEIQITPSLYTALAYLRLEDRRRTLWIDAICINQKDTAERTSQVALMGGIYSRASQVVIWLGESIDTTEMMFAFIRRWGELDHNTVTKASFKDNPLSHLQGFLLRPWFHRLWTFQEVVLSRQAEIQCGHFRMSWKSFAFAMRALSRTSYKWIVDKVTSAVWPKVFYWLMYNGHIERNADHFSLVRLMQYTNTHWSTDPRDSVYGLLGVASLKVERYRQPDYSITYREVIIKYRKMMMIEEGDLRAMAFDLQYPLYAPAIEDFQPREVWLPCAGRSVFQVLGEEFIFPKAAATQQTVRLMARCLDTVKKGFPLVSLHSEDARSVDFTSFAKHVESDIGAYLDPSFDIKDLPKVLLRVIFAGRPAFLTESGCIESSTVLNIESLVNGRTLFVTEGGRIGISGNKWRGTLESKKIYTFLGGSALYLIRGGLEETYVEGLMDLRLRFDVLPSGPLDTWPCEKVEVKL